MPTFIKLTTMSDSPIWVRAESIAAIEPMKDNSIVSVQGKGDLIIQEAPEEIIKKVG